MIHELIDRIRKQSRELLFRHDPRWRCARCKLTEDDREAKWIRYHRNGREAAPLCKTCFDEVDHVIAARYFNYLWTEKWGRDNMNDEFQGCYQTFLQYAIFDKLERGREPIEDFSDPSEMRDWAPTRMTVDEAKELLEGRMMKGEI